MPVVIAVSIGGALGAASRYLLDGALERRIESVLPWSTFVVNVTGCLAVGFLVAAIVDRHRAPHWLRIGAIVGFCGGFTTFSTFAQEALDLVEARDIALALLYAGLSVVVCVAAVLAGTALGRMT